MPKATDLQSTASPLCYGRSQTLGRARFRPDLNRHCYGRNVVFYRIKLQKRPPRSFPWELNPHLMVYKTNALPLS